MHHAFWGLSLRDPHDDTEELLGFSKIQFESTGLSFLTMISFCFDFEDVSIRDVIYLP